MCAKFLQIRGKRGRNLVLEFLVQSTKAQILKFHYRIQLIKISCYKKQLRWGFDQKLLSYSIYYIFYYLDTILQ